MAGLRRTDEVVVGDAEAVPRLAEAGGVAVGLFLGRDARFLGGLGDLQAVFVGACEEVGVVTEQAMPAGDGVSDDGRIGVADVRGVVDVVDRRGDVEAADPLRLGAEPTGEATNRHSGPFGWRSRPNAEVRPEVVSLPRAC
jgi:hypothetical protein